MTLDRNPPIHSLQHPRLLDPNHHSPARHPLSTSGFRSRLQLHLRDPYPLGTFHTALAHWDPARVYWRHANSRVRRHEGAGALSGRVVGFAGETPVFAVDGGNDFCGCRDTSSRQGELDLEATVEAYGEDEDDSGDCVRLRQVLL